MRTIWLCLVFTFFFVFATGCSDSAETSASDSTARSGEVDMDLTGLSGTILSAQLFNITDNPSFYVGQTMRIQGQFFSYDFDGNYFTNIIVSQDVAGCCVEGMEFVWDDRVHVFPDDYPEQDANIEVVGVYSTFEENGRVFYYLAVDDLVILS